MWANLKEDVGLDVRELRAAEAVLPEGCKGGVGGCEEGEPLRRSHLDRRPRRAEHRRAPRRRLQHTATH